MKHLMTKYSHYYDIKKLIFFVLAKFYNHESRLGSKPLIPTFLQFPKICTHDINPFVPNELFPYPLKTSENGKVALGVNRLLICQYSHLEASVR